MAGMDMETDTGIDPQDSAEIYDETHLDDEGNGDALLDEMDDVFDATRTTGGGADMPAPEENFGTDDEPSPLEAAADALLGQSDPADEEIELVFTGLLRNQRGAQGSAAHWEARRLSDEDVERLGYITEHEEDAMTRHDPHKPADEHDVEGPATRPVTPTKGKPDQLAPKLEDAEDRQEALIDEAVEETMDASDPPSPKHIT